MRMGIFFGGAAMRGPAGVSDAVGAIERLEADRLFQIAQLAFGAAALHAFALSVYRDSRCGVAAIVQLSETLNDDGDYLLLAYISHDAAHWLIGSFYRWGPWWFGRSCPAWLIWHKQGPTLRGRNETL